ncbi:hypothetical protein COLO4_07541 [Corchorus olitorius]|uniref:Myb/SANT-like domain-containing protein n=1 Tax=Corchorus olitorius TaxID=93759 RepID=A0A1R3KJD5_9ROSI|nr:hypothetical protein COLO4_07541 [Corchorus olitorius]
MDRVLADILRDQRNLGNKSDGSWKSIAYNNAASALSSQFNVSILGDNVKSRVKIWKKWYGIVHDILSQSGFNWDGTTCMITVDNESAWNDYVKSHPDAKCFRFKVIPNWDDIVDLCAKDRATGHGAETAMDANEHFNVEQNDGKSSEECETDSPSDFQGLEELNIESQNGASPSHCPQKKRGQSTTSSIAPSKRKRMGRNDELAIAMGKIANSFTEFIRTSEKKIDVKEVMDELNMISDFDRQQRLKALKWLTENETQFYVVKNLPLDEKKDYIMMFMP